jgi:hypothetical protein
MAKKRKKSGAKKSGGRPAVVALGRKRGAKSRVGKTSRGAARKTSAKSKPSRRRYR